MLATTGTNQRVRTRLMSRPPLRTHSDDVAGQEQRQVLEPPEIDLCGVCEYSITLSGCLGPRCRPFPCQPIPRGFRRAGCSRTPGPCGPSLWIQRGEAPGVWVGTEMAGIEGLDSRSKLW